MENTKTSGFFFAFPVHINASGEVFVEDEVDEISVDQEIQETYKEFTESENPALSFEETRDTEGNVYGYSFINYN